MKSRNLLLLFVCLTVVILSMSKDVNAQKETVKGQTKIVKLNCPESLGFVTNIPNGSRACEFYFHKLEETPTMFYIPNFSHEQFFSLTLDGNEKIISRARLVKENHIAAIHDFIYCYNKDLIEKLNKSSRASTRSSERQDRSITQRVKYNI